MDPDHVIPTITDCLRFKVYLHRVSSLKPGSLPGLVPSSESFKEIYRLYLANKLEATPQLPFNSPPGADPFQGLRQKSTAWPFFDSIVKRFGSTLNQVRVVALTQH